jgi:multiple sugar transport system substrate-binding protein
MMESNHTILRGITWNHSRGYLPMVATAQRFLEMNPSVEVRWEKRSLQEFADYPIEKLAETFDLLVIDHPFSGYAAAHPILLALDEHLSADFLAEQARESLGKSHESYCYGGHQWALAIDAATPVSCWRPDLAERCGVSIPETWEELLTLAGLGRVVMPCIPVDCLMHFFMLCASLGEEPCSRKQCLISQDVGTRALRMLKELTSLCPPEIFGWNPISVYEAMTSRDFFYCPFAYGYSNYARPGYARTQLQFGDLVQIGPNGPGRSTLGGTGLAVSARCTHKQAALSYARFVTSSECQRTLYPYSGGQPAHRSAWTDDLLNHHCADFFRMTIAAVERAYVRPRYDGYIPFQDKAGILLYEFLQKEDDARRSIDELQRLYEHRGEQGLI